MTAAAVASDGSLAPAGDGRGAGGALPFAAVVAAALSLNFAMVTVTGAIASRESGSSLKVHHCVLAALGALVLLRGRVVRPRVEMALYFAVTLVSSALASLAFGPQRASANLLISLYAGVVAGSLGLFLGERRTIRALRAASLVALAAVVVKDALHAPAFVVFFAKPDGHPLIPTFCIGGPNLEATWLTLASAFFIGSRLFLPYALAALSISMLYASRVGVIIIVLAVLAAAARAVAGRTTAGAPSGRARRLLGVPVIAAVVAVAGVAAVRYADGLSYVAQRFQNIGDEPGSVGRLTLWRGGVEVFVAHPSGVGLGNAVPLLERALGIDVPEDNLHNLYLQHLVEAGVPGLLAYLAFGVMTWRRLVARRYQDQMLIYVLCYLVIATIQFSGADPLLWFVYGLQSGAGAAPDVHDDA